MGVITMRTKTRDPRLCWVTDGALCMLAQIDNRNARIALLEREVADLRTLYNQRAPKRTSFG